MITQQLLDFVKQQSALGISREAITNMLIGQGWSATDIDQAFTAMVPPRAQSAVASPTVSPTAPPVIQLVESPKKSTAGKWILITVGILIVVGVAVYFGGRMITGTTANQQQKVENIQIKSPLETLKVLDIPTTVSAAQYQEYLKGTIDASKLDGYTQSGTIGVSIDQGQVNVAFAPIPNINIGYDQLLTFSSVKNSKGEEILDATSSFETDPFFTKLADIQGDSEPIPYVSGDRSPTLLSGSSIDDISSVKGSIVLTLPADMTVVTFTPADVGKVVATPYGTTTLVSFASSTIVINYDGFKEKVASIQAFDANDNIVDCGTDFNIGDTGYDRKDYTLSDCNNAATVVFAEAGSVVKAEIPFDTSMGANVGTSSSAVSSPSTITVDTTAASAGEVSAEDKASVIDQEVSQYVALSSKNVSQIRAFLTNKFNATGDQADLTSLKNMSDSDVLKDASLIVSFGFPTVTDVSALKDILNAPSTTWKDIVQDGKETIQIIIPQDAGQITLTITKVNGEWY